MNKRNLVIIAFVAVALLQLYVPAQMVAGQEDILITGKEFRFRSAPVDPNDPFRGKFITLRYDANKFRIEDDSNWKYHDRVYVSISADKDGFVKIDAVSKTRPEDGSDFVKAEVSYIVQGEHELNIDYPFDRYYMTETKAPEAENIYRESEADTSQVAYGLVAIKNGEAVLKDVMINDTPIKQIVNDSLESWKESHKN
jgi:uncharacterized membrane-anchored protein